MNEELPVNINIKNAIPAIPLNILWNNLEAMDLTYKRRTSRLYTPHHHWEFNNFNYDQAKTLDDAMLERVNELALEIEGAKGEPRTKKVLNLIAESLRKMVDIFLVNGIDCDYDFEELDETKTYFEMNYTNVQGERKKFKLIY